MDFMNSCICRTHFPFAFEGQEMGFYSGGLSTQVAFYHLPLPPTLFFLNDSNLGCHHPTGNGPLFRTGVWTSPWVFFIAESLQANEQTSCPGLWHFGQMPLQLSTPERQVLADPASGSRTDLGWGGACLSPPLSEHTDWCVF